MRTLTFAALIFATSLVIGQEKPAAPAQEAETNIKVYTRMVQVPVVVTDKSGKVVTGLTQNDFTLTEEGKEQKIAAFDGVVTVRAPFVERKLEPGMYTNRLDISGGQRAVVVMVLDVINTPITDQAYTRAQMIKYLSESVQPGTLLSIRVISPAGVKVITDFTTDSKLVMAALQRAKTDVRSPALTPDQTRKPTPSEGGFQEYAGADSLYKALQTLADGDDPMYTSFSKGVALMDTISAMRSVAQSLKGIPGRKSVIWATASFPFHFDDVRGFSSKIYDQRFARMVQEFNDANISVYPVDARGLVGKLSARASEFSSNDMRGPDTRNSATRAGLGFGVGSPEIGFDPLDTLRYMADVTGGIAYVNTNDLATSFRKAEEDSTAYYLLGYYLTRKSDSPPEWRNIKVRVNRPGLNIRTRNGVFAVPKPQDLPGAKEADLGAAQRTPTNLTGLGMVVDWLPDAAKPNDPSKFYIQVNAGDITIAGDNQLSVDFLIVARSADGKLLDQVSQRVEGKVKNLNEFRSKPLLFSQQLKPVTKDAVVRFIVRDNQSGNMGSVVVDTANLKP